MNYFKTSIGIFILLASSRFIPHPPNFTNLLALSFYVPLFLGISFIPVIIFSFLVTDLYFGFHSTLFFTWGSVALIGYLSVYFKGSTAKRFLGVSSAAILFFIVSNFGVWVSGGYGYTMGGLINCYILAIPFFWGTLSSTIIYAIIIEFAYKIYLKSYKKIRVS